MLSVQNRGGVSSPSLTFQAHMPRKFSSMMNYLYKNTPDIFENRNSMHVSTILENGEEVSGIVNFLNGKYHSLVMDDGSEHLIQEFKRTAMKHYNTKIAKRQLQEKLGYDDMNKKKVKKQVKMPSKRQLIETFGVDAHLTKGKKSNDLGYQRHLVKKFDYNI